MQNNPTALLLSTIQNIEFGSLSVHQHPQHYAPMNINGVGLRLQWPRSESDQRSLTPSSRASRCFNSCFSDTVFVTLFCTAVETAISGVHKLLRTGGVPTSLTLLIWRWLTVSSVFAGRSARTSCSSLTRGRAVRLYTPSSPHPPFDFCGRKAPCSLTLLTLPSQSDTLRQL